LTTASPSPGSRAARLARAGLFVLGLLWALPNTLLGLLLGLAGLPFGARFGVERAQRAVVVRQWPWGQGALTLGNSIVHSGADLRRRCRTYADRAGEGAEPLVPLDAHERAHVYQAMVLGPLFLPVYLLAGGVSARNPFERAADRYAATGRGWWPR
jgi:hypothetical protein